MKVVYKKNNNHFMFYFFHNKFIALTLLTPLEKNPEIATVLNKRSEVDLNLHKKKKKKIS